MVSAHFSPDGRRIVTTSLAGDAHLWDAETHAEIATLRGHEGALGLAAFSPDSGIVATISVEGTVRLWGAVNGTEVGVLETGRVGVPFNVANAGIFFVETEVAFSPDGSRLVAASREGKVRLWDVRRKTQIGVLVHADRVEHVEFSPDGRKILSCIARRHGTAVGCQRY